MACGHTGYPDRFIFSILRLVIATLLTSLFTFRAHAINTSLLRPPRPYSTDRSLKYGQSVCVDPSGRQVVIGANGYASFQGRAFLYTRHESQRHSKVHWRHAVLSANDSQSAEERTKQLRPHARGSAFGFSCAFPSATVSSVNHGLQFSAASFVVVGAPGHDVQRGAVYIFATDNSSDTSTKWTLVSKLTAESTKRRSGDLFGWAVAVDATCATVAVSARGRQANNGHVYMFQCDIGCTSCREYSSLNSPDYTDAVGPRGIRIRNNFGISVAMAADGATIVIGSTGFEHERGAAYVYHRSTGNDSKTDWSLVQRLDLPSMKAFSFFGYKVAIDAIGSVIAVGADGEDEYTGAVYVFEKDHEAAVMDKQEWYSLGAEVRADNGVEEDNFGGSVALSGNGMTMAVGAPGREHGDLKDHGVLYIYRGVTEKRRKKRKWYVIDTVTLPQDQWQAGTLFAWAVGINAEGTLATISAPDGGNGAGLALLATVSADDWARSDDGDNGKQEL